MIMPLDRFKQMFEGKTVSIIGIGVSNSPLIRLLCNSGAQVTVRDKRSRRELVEIYEEYINQGVEFCLEENYLDNIKEDIIIKTPGMRFDTPQLADACSRGAVLTSEMEIFFELCPANIIAVTGSDGKTTTTTLIYKLLSEQGYKCWLGGNIGTPLVDKLDQIQPDDKVVLELSSFQLHTMKMSPAIAVITNITPNHLDMHKSMDEYIQAKINILKYQNEKSRLVINMDNPITAPLPDIAKGDVCGFSIKNRLKNGIYCDNGTIYFQDKEILHAKDIRLPGTHNIENYMAAIAAVWGMISIETIEKVAKSFGGVEHRIEFVKENNGIRFYNDSIATSPTRARAGLYSFEQKLILIAGGYDKKLPFDSFGTDVVERVKVLILIGQTGKNIEKSVKNAAEYNPDKIKIIHCKDLRNAVITANDNAQNGDIVILSPACASFDMFKNFDERGKAFKNYVMEL